MYKYSNWIRTYALKNCTAYQNFFRNVKNGKTQAFLNSKVEKLRLRNLQLLEKIKLTETKVKLPIIGWIKLKEHGYIPTNKKVVSATISEKNRRWYISVLVEEALEQTPEPERL